jgi:hypothetical protein
MQLKKIKRLAEFALMTVVFCGVLASAQVTTATVNGHVEDSSGAVIQDVVVTLHSLSSGIDRTITTDNVGRFHFEFVPVGDYTLKSSANGFQTVSASFHLSSTQIYEQTLKMAISNVVTSVEVTAETQVVDTTSSSQRAVISEEQMNELPVAKQDWTGLLQLGTGTIKPTTASTSGSVNSGSGLNINGLPSAGYNLTVDGTNATSNPETVSFNFYGGPNIINTVNKDAAAEVTLAKGIAPATVGNTVSGSININTKSGTNKFFGSLYEINEVSLYDARNQFLTYRPRSTFNEYGGSIGGPILREKLFFFGSYEGARLSAFKAISGTVPTPYLRTYNTAVATTYASLFSMFPTIAQPASKPTALTGTYSGAGATTQKDGNGIVRFDYNPNSSNFITARYIRARPYYNNPALLPVNARTTVGHTDAINATYTHSAGNWTYNTRFGYNGLLLNRVDGGFVAGLEQVKFGFDTGGPTTFLMQGSYTTIEEGIAFVHGPHSIQFGGIFLRDNAYRNRMGVPILSYSNITQFANNTPQTVSPAMYELPKGLAGLRMFKYQYGGYIQDDWRLAKNLTVNLGLRYDIFTVPYEDSSRGFNRGIDSSNPELGPGFGAYRPQHSLWESDHNNFQPRVGVAWRPLGTDSTLIRVGAGILASDHPLYSGGMSLWQPNSSTPTSISLNAAQTAASGLKYPIDETQYPEQIAALQSAGILSSELAGVAVNPKYPDPYSIQYTFGIAQTFPGNVTWTADYVGNKAYQLALFESRNQAGRTTNVAPKPSFAQFFYFSDGDHSNYNSLQTTLSKRAANGLMLQGAYTWAKVLSFGDADILQQLQPQDNDKLSAEYGSSPFDIRQRVSINGVWDMKIAQWANLNNNATKSLLNGWQISGVFTGQTGLPINVTDTSSSYPADRPDRGTGSLYASGDYRKRNASGVHQYLNNDLTGGSTAGFVRVALSKSGSGAQVRGGTLRRYGLRAPGAINFDASLAKSFRVMNRYSFQLRMDTFNVLNHTNYSGIVTTVNTSNFGQATTATARTMQIGGRFTF